MDKIVRSFNKELKEKVNKLERKITNMKGKVKQLQTTHKNRKSSRRLGSKLSEAM